MKIKDLTAPLEQFAPLSYQESYDNSGLIVGDYDDEVDAALLCVDATEDVLEEAERLGCQIVISHHPIIFHAIKRLNGSNYVEKTVEHAVRRGIALYACHTNLDSAPGGLSFALAGKLGIENPQMLVRPAGPDSPNGFGVIGTLAAPEDTLGFLQRVRSALGAKVVRHSGFTLAKVSRIAVCGGSGAPIIEAAKDAGAELYIAADFKYNDFMLGGEGFIVADIGHFESEFCAIDLMYDIISKKIATFALHKSKSSRNPINYLV